MNATDNRNKYTVLEVVEHKQHIREILNIGAIWGKEVL